MNRARQTEAMLKALAEPQRVAILRLVRSRELKAGEIASHFRTTRSGISQHLRVLTTAGILSQRRQGTCRLYQLRLEAYGQLKAFLDGFWEQSLARLKSEAEMESKRKRDR